MSCHECGRNLGPPAIWFAQLSHNFSPTTRRPPRTLSATTALVTTTSSLARNHRASTASDGELTGGSVISSAPAGRAQVPRASIASTIATLPAIGKTNRVPASAKHKLRHCSLPISGPISGKSHARAFHDLRGTAATKLFRADLNLREIAEIMGWSEERVGRLIDRYVKRDEILRNRIRRIEKAERRTKAVKQV
jgi:hypothetical protein